MVVVMSPLINLYSRFVYRSEPVPVEALVPEFAIEAFHKGILSGFARLDESEFHARFLTPEEHRFAGKFGAVVTDHLLWLSSLFTDPIQEPSNLSATD